MTKLFQGPYAEECQQFYYGWHSYLQEQLREWYQIFTVDLAISENAKNNELINTLRIISQAAESGGDPEIVIETINALLQSQPPARFMTDKFRWMLIQAEIKTDDDELITLSEAAKILDIAPSNITIKINAGKLAAFIDPFEPNPRRNKRIKRSEIENAQK